MRIKTEIQKIHIKFDNFYLMFNQNNNKRIQSAINWVISILTV